MFLSLDCERPYVVKLNSCRYLQGLEKRESEVRSNCNAKPAALEYEVNDLEERVAEGSDGEISEEDLDVLLVESLDHLTSAKKVFFLCYRQPLVTF